VIDVQRIGLRRDGATVERHRAGGRCGGGSFCGGCSSRQRGEFEGPGQVGRRWRRVRFVVVGR
jgi:hypothetical protein